MFVFRNSPLTSWANFQTHGSILPCVCLCLGMVWAWLVGVALFRFGFREVAGGLFFEFPFNTLGQLPNTWFYHALCGLEFGHGLGMVGWMAGVGFGLAVAE